jgi:hypothetical protein
LYCRKHHLLKTFFTGPTGWADRQLPDGTVILTSPTGHTYRTEPQGGVLFAELAKSTGALAIPPTVSEPITNRGLMMPSRKQSRAQDRRARTVRERRVREARIADGRRKHIDWLAANYEPPPF